MNQTLSVAFAFVLLLAASVAQADDKNEKFDLKKKPDVDIGVNLHALWTFQSGESSPYKKPGDLSSPDHEFSMAMARFEAVFEQGDWVTAKLQGDFDEVFDGDPAAMMRDGWVRLSPLDEVQLTLGQFKRPFSRLELRSMGKLETIWRGPSNAFLMKKLGFGERDLGVQVSGRFGDKNKNVSYAVGAFNGTGKNAEEEDPNGAKDVVARVTGRPLEWLEIGVAGSFKFFDRQTYDMRPESSWAAEVDLEVDLDGLFILAEGLYGTNHDPCVYSTAPDVCRAMAQPDTTLWNALLLVAYKLPLYGAWKISLQPMAKVDVLAPDMEASDGLLYTVTGGLNLWFGKHLRFMVHYEGEFPAASETYDYYWLEKHRFMTQLAFDL